LFRLELFVAVAVVDRVDPSPRCHDLVDAVQGVGAEGDVGGREERIEPFHSVGPMMAAVTAGGG
jgi:hypothetical protein